MFGCEAFSYIIYEKKKKLDKRAKKCIFVGYDSQHKGYRLYSLSYKGVFISRDVKFNELFEESTSNEDVDDLDEPLVAPSWLDINVDKSPQEKNSPTQRVTRSMTLNKSLFFKINNKNEPSSFKQASKHECWMEAMKVEFEALMKNKTWDLVPYPNEKNVIGNKWIYKVKYNLVGDIEKYKARLVAKGVAQKYGVDYEETFALMAKMPTVRIILSLSATQG